MQVQEPVNLMSIDIGNTITSKTYPEKGTGSVIKIQTIFGNSYADVFFERTREKFTLPLPDLEVSDTPETAIKSGKFSPARVFLLRLLKDQIKAAATQDTIQSAANFKIIPLPHQILTVNFVLDQFKPRALIADEVGLGKTIEAALIFEELKARGIAKRALIIAPSGLCYQWQDEMKTKFAEDFAIYDSETIHTLKKLHGQDTNIWKLSDKIITSIDFLKPRTTGDDLDDTTKIRRDHHNQEVFQAAVHAHFDVVIIDEAHKLTKDETGTETARYKLGKSLSDTTPILLLLTATPHQGDTAKFRNLLALIDPYLFYKNSDVTPDKVLNVAVRNNKRAVSDFQGNRIFKQRITSLCTIGWDKKVDEVEIQLYDAVTEYVTTFYDLAQRENNRTMMFLLLIYQRMASSSSRAIFKSLSRRLEVLTRETQKIPDQENDSEVNNISPDQLDDSSPEEQLENLTRAIENQGQASEKKLRDLEIRMLKTCVTLAKNASTGRNDIKFKKLLEVLDEFKIRENAPGLKFIIFTEFVETQNYLNENLHHLGYSTALINGRMSLDEKTVQKRLFQDTAQILISTDAGGEGINLQFCRVMINYDLPWNPMRLEQRIGRIDRIGQAHDVKIVNFQLADTVEQRVRDTIERKLERIKREFIEGEDKLADILTTLDDEFSFEKIYIDAIRKKQTDAAHLDTIATQIYDRAKAIITKGDMILPFSDLTSKYTISAHDIEKQSNRARQFIELYLQTHNKELLPYKTKENVYFFDDPISGKRLSNVIFDQKLSLENEEYDLLSFTHPFVQSIISSLDRSLEGVTAARFIVKENKFRGVKGFLHIYELTISNNIDPARKYTIPIFIETNEQYNTRISQIFEDVSQISIEELITGEQFNIPDQMEKSVYDFASQKAERVYYDYKVNREEQLKKMEVKTKQYFLDKASSVRRIAVTNIRDSKMKELEHDRKRQEDEMMQRRLLVPQLQKIQVSYVEFQ